jgi:hypothetical protein
MYQYSIQQPETAIASLHPIVRQNTIALFVAEEGRRVQADNAKIADNCLILRKRDGSH